MEGRFVQANELADMRHADEYYDGDRGGVLGQAEAEPAREERLPGFGGGEEDGEEHSADRADDGVEEGGEGELVVSALELLDGFVEVDYTV